MVQTAAGKRQNPEEIPASFDDEAVDEIPGSFGTEEANEFHSGKIYCANCIHCKLVPTKLKDSRGYLLRIRCAAGKWKKKLGTEKFYKYCTITRRYLDSCDAYEEMGDTREFIRELRKSLLGEEALQNPVQTMGTEEVI
jgi:hypothetical protein